MRVHAIQTGSLTGNETIMRGKGWPTPLQRRRPVEFPAYCFIVEHPVGLIAIDTGITSRVRIPRILHRFIPDPHANPDDEVGPRMTAAGLSPDDVRTVVLTHLDWDHAGGLAHFPQADIHVHRPEYEFAATRLGRLRYQPKLWPQSFTPRLFDLAPEPLGPFPSSYSVPGLDGIRIVPLAGHSIGQVGVVLNAGQSRLFFAADHILRKDWFEEDWQAGRRLGLGALFFPEQARETGERVHAFASEPGTVLLPSHDDETPTRLGAAVSAGP